MFVPLIIILIVLSIHDAQIGRVSSVCRPSEILELRADHKRHEQIAQSAAILAHLTHTLTATSRNTISKLAKIIRPLYDIGSYQHAVRKLAPRSKSKFPLLL